LLGLGIGFVRVKFIQALWGGRHVRPRPRT
jgi:hypothetical protein